MSPSSPHAASTRKFLADRLDAAWDGDYLLCGTNQALVYFDTPAEPAVLWLAGIHVAQVGQGLGGRIIVALRDHVDQTGQVLHVGPVSNSAYWQRHQWLSPLPRCGEPFLHYRPAGA